MPNKKSHRLQIFFATLLVIFAISFTMLLSNDSKPAVVIATFFLMIVIAFLLWRFRKGVNRKVDFANNTERKVQGDNQNNHDESWSGSPAVRTYGELIERGNNKVTITGYLEAGSNVIGLLSFRVTVKEIKSNRQSEAEILVDRWVKGVNVGDRVELNGYRTKEGFIKVNSILNLNTNVRQGKPRHRYWLLFPGFLFAIITIVTGGNNGIGMLAFVIVFFTLILFSAWTSKPKFSTDRLK